MGVNTIRFHLSASLGWACGYLISRNSSSTCYCPPSHSCSLCIHKNTLEMFFKWCHSFRLTLQVKNKSSIFACMWIPGYRRLHMSHRLMIIEKNTNSKCKFSWLTSKEQFGFHGSDKAPQSQTTNIFYPLGDPQRPQVSSRTNHKRREREMERKMERGKSFRLKNPVRKRPSAAHAGDSPKQTGSN